MLQNTYHRRLTSPAHPKSCTICYKPSTTVLITPDKRDWFYICPTHLSNTSFAKPLDAPINETNTKEELEKEIEAVKKEWDERQARRKKKKKYKAKSKAKSKEKDDDETGLEDKTGAEEEEDRKAEEEKDAKVKALEEKKKEAAAGEGKADDGPRIFALDKAIFQSRVSKVQAAQVAKRRREQFGDPGFLPSVPKGGLG